MRVTGKVMCGTGKCRKQLLPTPAHLRIAALAATPGYRLPALLTERSGHTHSSQADTERPSTLPRKPVRESVFVDALRWARGWVWEFGAGV